LRKPQDRMRRALVGERPRSFLKRGKVEQQPSYRGVDVVIDRRRTAGWLE
jgi:hypothetical protein